MACTCVFSSTLSTTAPPGGFLSRAAERGANGEQTCALDGPELHSTTLNETTPTCGGCILQVDGCGQSCREWLYRVSSPCFWEQIPGHPGPLSYEHPLLPQRARSRAFGRAYRRTFVQPVHIDRIVVTALNW
jgi:hypothetical protein